MNTTSKPTSDFPKGVEVKVPKVAQVLDRVKQRAPHQERPFVIGLTGGIGSGKTMASDYLASLGVHCVDTDLIARQVVAKGSSALDEICVRFGSTILLPDGELDRPALRIRVFADDADRLWLNGLLHPLIGAATQRAIATTKSVYCLMIVPLLFESGGQNNCDLSLMIDAPVSSQILRTKERDQSPDEVVENIIASQMSREKKKELADIIVSNDDSTNQLYARLDAVHFYLLSHLAKT